MSTPVLRQLNTAYECRSPQLHYTVLRRTLKPVDPLEVRMHSPQSQSFFQRYRSNLPTSLVRVILSTKGC